MKTLYLHVGNFKTGTSAIQKYCSDNRKQLMENGLNYLREGSTAKDNSNHSKLPLSLIAKYGHSLPSWYSETDSFESVASAILGEIEDSAVENILVSSEEFYRLPGYRKATIKGAIEDLRRLFAGKNVRVIMYVREPMPFVKSWYNQVNKDQLPYRRFIDFLYFLNESLIIPRKNAAFWRDCFGADCLILEPYRRQGYDHIQRFMTLVNTNIDNISFNQDMLVNPKRSELSLEQDRIDRIMTACSITERETYLRSFVFNNENNFRLLRNKILRINREFAKFCREENIPFENSRFTLRELLVHEEHVNRKDVVTTYPGKTSKSRNLGTSFLRRFKKDERTGK